MDNIIFSKKPARYLTEDFLKSFRKYISKGIFHRTDGPAVIFYWSSSVPAEEQWWINGDRLEDELLNRHLAKISISKKLKAL